jgi:hypothetical protein
VPYKTGGVCLPSDTTNVQATAVRAFSPPSRILQDKRKDTYIDTLFLSRCHEASMCHAGDQSKPRRPSCVGFRVQEVLGVRLRGYLPCSEEGWGRGFTEQM